MSEHIANITDSPAEKLAGGFGFTEGPLWHPDGYWLFVDIRTLQIHKMSPSGQLEIFRDPSFGTNGMTFDKQGNLIICESDNRCMARREADSAIETLESAVKLFSKDLHLTTLLGRWLVENGQFERADAVLSPLLEHRQDARAYFYRGRAREELDRRPAAVEDYRSALRLDPGWYSPHYRLAQLLEADEEEASRLRDKE